MTAQKVGTLAVIADEPTESPHLRDNKGRPIVWTRTRTLLLEDGSTAYGCADCDYTSLNIYSIRPHQNVHVGARNTSRRPMAAIGDMSLDQLAKQLARMQEMAEELATWKARATKAEKALALLRKALS